MTQKLVTLYIPEDVYSIIKQKAKEEDRSVNNYINRILKLQTNTSTSNTSVDTTNTNTTETIPTRRRGDLW